MIAMDALDQLLVSCHDYSLNLFVESFLKMVQKLLECDELELQILATSSVSKTWSPDKSGYWKITFFISHPKQILWVLKRSVSVRRFF